VLVEFLDVGTDLQIRPQPVVALLEQYVAHARRGSGAPAEERAQGRLKVPIFHFGRTHLQTRQYVGAVRAGNTTVQILPKIYDKEQHNLGFLLFMLRYTRRLRLRQAGLTDYEKLRGTFLEIWIRYVGSELNRLLRTQPKHRYVEVEERTGFLRGKRSKSRRSEQRNSGTPPSTYGESATTILSKRRCRRASRCLCSVGRRLP
jgi:hypothetical protein